MVEPRLIYFHTQVRVGRQQLLYLGLPEADADEFDVVGAEPRSMPATASTQ
jgi:hypothetical protein